MFNLRRRGRALLQYQVLPGVILVPCMRSERSYNWQYWWVNLGNHAEINWLTHLCRMDFPIFINRTGPFPILGLYGGIFHSHFDRTYKRTVETLIRCGIWSGSALFAYAPHLRGMIQKFWSLPCSFVQRQFWKAYHAPFKRTSFDLYNDDSIFSLYCFVL